MKEILTKLQRPLTREDIDFRVGSVITSTKIFATILAYKDARTDMKVLDEATDGMWQNEYRRDSKGVLQCGIGIKSGDEWVWKWSNGTASDIEKEKGEYSDAFKRAGFMWGIGRELYDVPTLFLELRSSEYRIESGKAKGTSKLRPNDWTWEITNDLKTFKATDKEGQRLYVDASEHEKDAEVQTPEAAPKVDPKPVQSATEGKKTCVECKKPFTPKAGTESYAKTCYPCYKAKADKALPKFDPKESAKEDNYEDMGMVDLPL